MFFIYFGLTWAYFLSRKECQTNCFPNFLRFLLLVAYNYIPTLKRYEGARLAHRMEWDQGGGEFYQWELTDVVVNNRTQGNW